MRGFWRSEDGATAIEYALMVSLIFVAIVGAVALVGSQTEATYDTIGDKVGGAL